MTEIEIGLAERGYPITLPEEIHRQPIVAYGISGSGKSTALGTLALQFSELGNGVLVIDIKDGELARQIVSRSDPEKTIYVSPGQCFFDGHPHHWGLNVLEPPIRNRFGFDLVVDNVVSMFERLGRADYDIMTQIRSHLANAVRLANFERNATLVTVFDVLNLPAKRKELLDTHGEKIPYPTRTHWEQFDNPKVVTVSSRYQALRSTIARMEEILEFNAIYYTVAQPKSTIRLQEWLLDGKLVVVDCASGQTTPTQARILGALILTQAMHLTFVRSPAAYTGGGEVDEPTGPDIRIVADEFYAFAGSNFARLIEQARAYKVFPLLAHQNKAQIDDPRLLSDLSSAPIELEFDLTHTDRVNSKHPERKNPGKYKAYLTLNYDSLPYGLLDRGQGRLIRLKNWWQPASAERYRAAVEAQRQYVTAEIALRETMEPYESHQELFPDPAGVDDPATPQRLPKTSGRVHSSRRVPRPSFIEGEDG